MIEYLNTLDEWKAGNHRISIARVIKTWGSSPRPVGSIMLINDQGKMSGSVSGGCVENAVVKNALESIKNKDSRKLSFGVTDDDAWTVGLSCGGNIEVFVQPINIIENQVWKALLENIKTNKSSILISSLEDGNNTNTLVSEDGSILGDRVANDLIVVANKAYSERTNKTIPFNEKEYFIQVFPRKSQLLIIGAAHIAVDLVSLGNQFGFETIVIDPRGYFAANTVFIDAPSRLIEKYPSEILQDFALDAYTYCAILSHDPKIDDNALELLLPSDVAYIGVLGSKKNNEKRKNRLLEKGVDLKLIEKIKGPIGIAINAKSAKEIALSIMAEIIQEKNKYL